MEAAGPVGLVTGAASGLGRAVLASLRRQGWRTVGVDLTEVAGADLAHLADVTDAAALAAAVADAVERLGGLDGVAACAGVNAGTFALAHRLPRTDWDRLVGINLTGSFLTAQAVLPHLAVRGGALVLVSSVSAHDPLPGAAHYSAAKAGVVALTRSLALEYGRAGVRVNSVAPGYMDTPMSAPVLDREPVRRRIEATIPLGRVAAPQEVAEVVAWLLGPGAGYLTGQDLVVDGGLGLTTYSNPSLLDRLWADEPS
jgi:NAD(P)-dependent dehydrogenase (short-subunit alcohol dehydrogenase family)